MVDDNVEREVDVNSGTLPADGIENPDRALGVQELREDLEDETVVDAVDNRVVPPSSSV